MHILNSDILTSKFDVFWQDIPSRVAAMSQRPVLIITPQLAAGSPQETQLTKMIEACRLTPDQYNMLQLAADEQPGWHQLRNQLNPLVVFIVGIMPVQIGVSALFSLNEPNHFNDTIWLPSLPLEELERSKELKGQLWSTGMKPIFIEKKFGELVSPGLLS
jgi:hypothetical protein